MLPKTRVIAFLGASEGPWKYAYQSTYFRVYAPKGKGLLGLELAGKTLLSFLLLNWNRSLLYLSCNLTM